MRRVHAFPFGAQRADAGATFALWAPSAEEVRLWTPEGESPMERDAQGWHRARRTDARPGQLYRFRIGDLLVPDPASRFQPDDIDGPSMWVDPAAYDWADGDWRGRPWDEAVIYELHVGTFTPEGTYVALSRQLEALRDLGITAIELMPLADFPGSRSWGYDGVLPYAPDSAYGTPAELKALIDHAHRLGLMVFLDVVYNHFGPQGNYLPGYARPFFTERHQTLWGAGINFDGEQGRVVRDFFLHNALYWLEEYHFDGLRFDAVHAIADDSQTHLIAELASHIRAELPGRHIHLILENNANEARWLDRGADRAATLHTAQWNDDIHHAWHRLLTGEAEGYYGDYEDPVAHLGRCLAEGFAYQGETSAHDGVARGEPSAHLPPSAFIAFLQNHDQIGNRACGERLVTLAAPEKLALARAVLLLGPQIPMLFMGEEWGASTPFQYFVDFTDTELAGAVREGRMREFAGFGAFRDEALRDRIPDPTIEDTFKRSRLDWREREEPQPREVLAETQALLAIRRDHVVPLLGSPDRGARWTRTADDLVDVTWEFAAGSLRLMLNLGESHHDCAVDDGWTVIWASTVAEPGQPVLLAPWTGVFLTRRI